MYWSELPSHPLLLPLAIPHPTFSPTLRHPGPPEDPSPMPHKCPRSVHLLTWLFVPRRPLSGITAWRNPPLIEGDLKLPSSWSLHPIPKRTNHFLPYFPTLPASVVITTVVITVEFYHVYLSC